MLSPALLSVSVLEAITASAAVVLNIDSTSLMRSDNVWIFAGMLDSVVKPGVQRTDDDGHPSHRRSGT